MGSRAPLNDDRAPIVAKLVEATFSSWACSWGPCRWLFCRLLTAGLTLSAGKLRTWENISLPTLAPTLKRSFSWSGWRRFFFSLELPSSASLDGQQDVQCQKVHLLAERSWTNHMQGTWASPSNVRGLRSGRSHNLPQVCFLSLQVFVTYCANATTKPVSTRTSTSVPRTRSSFSAFAFTVTNIVKVTGKGATTTLPIPSPNHPCSRRRDRRSGFGRRAEPNTRIKNIDIAVAANLEPWRRGYHLARAS